MHPGGVRQSSRPRSRLRRVIWWSLSVLLALFVTWLVFVYLVILRPQTSDPPAKADAIVVLGPSLGTRLDDAMQLASELHVNQMLVSVGDSGTPRSPLCTQPQRGITITCFIPRPGTTQGEARELGKVAAQRHWTTVIVYADKPHLSRAQMLFKRCFSGRVQMVPDNASLTVGRWLYEFAYQTGAYVKAELQSGC